MKCALGKVSLAEGRRAMQGKLGWLLGLAALGAEC